MEDREQARKRKQELEQQKLTKKRQDAMDMESAPVLIKLAKPVAAVQKFFKDSFEENQLLWLIVMGLVALAAIAFFIFTPVGQALAAAALVYIAAHAVISLMVLLAGGLIGGAVYMTVREREYEQSADDVNLQSKQDASKANPRADAATRERQAARDIKQQQSQDKTQGQRMAPVLSGNIVDKVTRAVEAIPGISTGKVEKIVGHFTENRQAIETAAKNPPNGLSSADAVMAGVREVIADIEIDPNLSLSDNQGKEIVEALHKIIPDHYKDYNKNSASVEVVTSSEKPKLVGTPDIAVSPPSQPEAEPSQQNPAPENNNNLNAR